MRSDSKHLYEWIKSFVSQTKWWRVSLTEDGCFVRIQVATEGYLIIRDIQGTYIADIFLHENSKCDTHDSSDLDELIISLAHRLAWLLGGERAIIVNGLRDITKQDIR